MENNKTKTDSRRFKYGTISTVVTIIFIAIVVLVNVVSTMLLERYPTKIDLTYNKLYELSDSTIDYIKTLDKEVDITVLSDKANLLTQIADGGKQLVEVLEKYPMYNNKIHVRFIDPNKNPNVIKQLNEIYNGDVSKKFLVVSSNGKARAYEQKDLIKYDTNIQNLNEYKVTSNVEQSITSAIMYITDSNPVKVTVFKTAEEIFPLGSFEDILNKYAYEVVEINGMTDEIDSKSSLVVLNCPSSDLTPAQIKKLDDFLYNDGKLGKNLLYLPSVGQPSTPNLDAFLADWGIKVSDGFVDETDNNYIMSMGDAGNAVIAYPKENEFAIGIEDMKKPLVVPFARPIEFLFEKSGNVRTVDILSTSPNGRIIPANLSEGFNIETLPTQQTTLFGAGIKTAGQVESRVIVFGTPMIFSRNYTGSNNLNNESYPIHIINKATGKGQGVVLSPKTVTDTQLVLTGAQKQGIKNITTIFIPIVIIGIGIVVWALRRRR